MMKEIKENLESLLEDALSSIGAFRKKTYDTTFSNLYEEYKDTVERLEAHLGDTNEETDLGQIAIIIPDYAQKKLEQALKKEQKKLSMDLNLAMAAYVIPVLTYTRQPKCDKLAEEIISLWNERNVTGLVLSKSSYEKIAGGFKKGFCYITTAVCEDQNKPDDCRELTVLRTYRDQYMMCTEEGQKLVEEYYDIAPAIVYAINMHKDASAVYQGIYNEYLIPCIAFAENGENDACRELYKKMVRTLEKEYLCS